MQTHWASPRFNRERPASNTARTCICQVDTKDTSHSLAIPLCIAYVTVHVQLQPCLPVLAPSSRPIGGMQRPLPQNMEAASSSIQLRANGAHGLGKQRLCWLVFSVARVGLWAALSHQRPDVHLSHRVWHMQQRMTRRPANRANSRSPQH
jgi:hypothetical protein